MPSRIKWDNIRYRGDTQGTHELLEVYRVGHYLSTFEENQKRRDSGVRDELMRKGIRLSEQISPRIFRIYGAVCVRLGLGTDTEVFCLPDQEVNAMAVLDIEKNKTHSLIGVTSAALELLDDNELASIIGHELGHFLFEHNRFNALINRDQNSPSVTVLPALGESLFLRWRKMAEISADRVGLLACGNLKDAARALMKATFGLTDRNINLDIDALLDQIEEIKGKPELMEAGFASHPLLPIRLKALELFSNSKAVLQYGISPKTSRLLTKDDLETQIDQLIMLTARYPHKPLSKAVMKVVALGGIRVLSADGDISDYETKILIEILHNFFTDEPEKEIPSDRGHIELKLKNAIKQVVDLGDHSDKGFIISRLADIALADGALLDEEGAIILEIAQQLGLPPRTAYGVLVAATESVGFKVDMKLNRVADELRRSLRIGFGYTS